MPHISSFALRAFLSVATASGVVAQHGAGLRVVVHGGVLTVDVATADAVVEVTVPGSGTTLHTVAPDKGASISLANVPPGSLVTVSVGRGARRQSVLVEVLAP